MGETSGVAIRALSLGRPLVVSDLGWFAELPDEVALKIPVDEREPDALAAALESLAGDEARREAMAAAAAELRGARARPRPRRRPLRGRARGGRGRRRRARRPSSARSRRAAADVGIEADDPLAAEIAERLREVRVAE